MSRFLTIVYEIPDSYTSEEISSLLSHEHANIASWSHAFRECDAIEKASPSAPMIYMGKGNTDNDFQTGDDTDCGQWFLDCDDFYCDIVRDLDGKYSIFFKDRISKQEAWADQAAQSNLPQSIDSTS